jgi:LPXTG-motif cell wall-anchored protein
VLTTQAETATPPETRTAELARITPTGQEAAGAPEAAPAAPVGPSVIGEIAPPSIAIPETQQARAELPKTASSMPLIALVGLLLVAGGLLIRRVRLVRG